MASYMHVASAVHTAVLDERNGLGVLILPNPQDDVPSPDPLEFSIHSVDFDSLMRRLAAMGWQITENDDGGGWCYEGDCPGGGFAISLHKVEADDDDMDELAHAHARLLDHAGVNR